MGYTSKFRTGELKFPWVSHLLNYCRYVKKKDILIGTAKYGFNFSYSNYAPQIREIARDIVEIEDLDNSTPASRKSQRLLKEELKFDEDHYITDFVHENEDIQRILSFKPEFRSALKRIQNLKSSTQEKDSIAELNETAV